MKKLSFFILMVYTSVFFAQLPGFTLTGTPTTSSGATWTYQASVNSVNYDLQGILFKPNTTASVYPAVIINHGTGGNAGAYSKWIAQEMVKWGYVCIATNLCHSANAPQGSPGFTTSTIYFGASTENVQRSMKCWDILASLAYVDTNCIATFGHSRGAWTTVALAGLYPHKFSAAAHTAGGIYDNVNSVAAKSYMALGITAPYQMHHGDNDNTVALSQDVSLDSVLNITNITHTLIVYPGYTHSQIAQDTIMYGRTKAWFNQFACSGPTYLSQNDDTNEIKIFPNPTSDFIKIEGAKSDGVKFFNIAGKEVFVKLFMEQSYIRANVGELDAGIYFLYSANRQIKPKKFLVLK